MIYLLWILGAIGATHIITGTAIFSRTRNFFDKISPNFLGILFGCPTCMGFWIGTLFSLIIPIIQISELKFNFNSDLNIVFFYFLHGCFVSFFCWITNILTTLLDNITTTIELKNEIIVENPLEIAKAILKED